MSLNIPNKPTWAQLCQAAEEVCAAALLSLGIQRRQPTNSSKAQPAKVEQVVRHHKFSQQGEESIRIKRLRRLWRRVMAWKKGDRARNLVRHINRETRVLGIQGVLLQLEDADNLLDSIEECLLHDMDELKLKHISCWKSNLQQREKDGWKYLARTKLLAPVNYLKHDDGAILTGQPLFSHIEGFWSNIWPQQSQTELEEQSALLASLANPLCQAQTSPSPDLSPIQGIHIKAAAKDRRGKAAGKMKRSNTCP